MRSIVLLGVIFFLLAVVLAAFDGSSDTSLPTLDLRHLSTVFPRAASALRNIESRVRGWMDAGRASYQERFPDVEPAPSPRR